MRCCRWIGAVLLLAGCGDNELGVEKIRPNQAPETVLSSGPPDSTSATHYRVQLFWSGTDRDGTISHYDFILVNHPPISDHMGGDDDSTRVVITVPAPDDPRWTGTTATDSTFTTLADTLRREPRPGPGENGDDVREAPYERWHTFFVRAVDNEGMPDPTPDYRSFNSRNIAPTVYLTDPIEAGTDEEFEAPPVVIFNWNGEDPVDGSNSIQPVASRFVIISTRITVSGIGDKYINFPDSLYHLPSRYSWSPWRRWDLIDGSGKQAVITGLTLAEGTEKGYYLFAVQAMDEAGAITPVFDYQSEKKNNVVRVHVQGNVGPVLTVREFYLGTQAFVEGSRPIRLDIASGQPLRFRWSGSAATYGGQIVAYRYGWDIADPENPLEWSSWSASTTSAPARSFATGSHRFYLQVRDNAESITQAVYELTAHTVTRARSLLWVDDTDWQTDVSQELQETTRWLQVLGQIATDNGFLFDPNLDVFEVEENRREPPPIQKVFDYKAIVWSNRSGRNGSSALRRAAQFVDPIPSRNQNSARGFNYINIYLANGGCLWINGFRPARQLWPDERLPGEEYLAVNVTQWEDPFEQHPPGIDSVGTASLLYKMGIEMFDVGSSVEIERFHRDHFCRGPRRYAVPGGDPQRTTSSTDAGHFHTLDVPMADVEAFVPVSRTYETSQDASRTHVHTVTLSADDFAALKRGETRTVTSSEGALPVPHQHTFVVHDQVGNWGAPPLSVSLAWPQAGTGGRTNIEIYNMPGAMRNESPPLIPLPGISVVLYSYLSLGKPEDPLFYPDTADNQPMFVLAKSTPADARFTRAFCGFEIYALEAVSHRQLAEYLLVRHFGLGQSTPP